MMQPSSAVEPTSHHQPGRSPWVLSGRFREIGMCAVGRKDPSALITRIMGGKSRRHALDSSFAGVGQHGWGTREFKGRASRLNVNESMREEPANHPAA